MLILGACSIATDLCRLLKAVTNVHPFAIFRGAVSVGTHHDDIEPLYDLNNFNDYIAGLLTMFNIFVVNDWQEIARVYLSADKMSSPYIVYPFFLIANLFGVNITLNVLTAFFVGAFVTKVEDRKPGRNRDLRLSLSTPLYGIHTATTNNHANESIPGYYIHERHGYESVISTIITGTEGDMVHREQAMRDRMESEKMEAIRQAQDEIRSVADSEIESMKRAHIKLQRDSNEEKLKMEQKIRELESKVKAMEAAS